MPSDENAVTENLGSAVATVDGLIEGFFSMLPKVVIALVLFILMLVVASIVKALVKRILTSRASSGVGIALGRIVQLVIIFVGLLVSVAIVAPSVGAAELLQILGVGSVAIGFAFRDILQNFLAGLLLLLRQPFVAGDWIQFRGFEGTVQEVSTRSTWVKTFDGSDISIPNGELFKDPVTVMTKDFMIRTDYEIGVGYDADLEQAKSVILDAVESIDAVFDDKKPDIGVSDLAASSVLLRARWWTTTDDVYSTKLAVLQAIKEALDAAGISIPYPHRQLIVYPSATGQKSS
ncbi:mechanosensitive ion channel family protein [Cohaesibacter celericrescens]|uniref:Small-conductance mechanosensitive channel n=1 Tax=Cohaesibacter celericrescens TaxID=2067669 RepID=A0A2N5XSC5_9HYPH|nr:mechanosensitive ion channel family protein [Cohaesibacter celericrescens]PLW77347.1 mechanosensitive ion channel protein MscS [Cohaesibacter celericrescens]